MTDELSGDERVRLEDALHAVLAFIAGADGVVDAAESQRFARILESIASGGDPLLAEVARSAIASAPERARQARLDETTASERICAAAELADSRMPPEEARRFKHGLYVLGTQLAQASGGGALGLRSRTSDEERRALTALAQLLGVPA